MDFELIYDVRETWPSLWILLVLVPVAGLHAWLLRHATSGGGPWGYSRAWRDLGPGPRRAGTWTMFALWTTAVKAVSVMQVHEWLDARSAMATDTAQMVEGRIEDYRGMPEGGHGLESFRVAATHFSFSAHSPHAGYHLTVSDGGYLRPGSYARLYFIERAGTRLIVRAERAVE